MSTGLKVASMTQNEDKVRRWVESDNAHTIRLNFPNLDFNIAYGSQHESHLRKTWDSDVVDLHKPCQIGVLCPHVLIEESDVTVREMIAHISVEKGQSTNVEFLFKEKKHVEV